MNIINIKIIVFFLVQLGGPIFICYFFHFSRTCYLILWSGLLLDLGFVIRFPVFTALLEWVGNSDWDFIIIQVQILVIIWNLWISQTGSPSTIIFRVYFEGKCCYSQLVLVVLTVIYSDFSQSLQVNCGVVP
jgi:hypothetical protein